MSLTQFSDQYITDRFDSAHYELIHKIGEGGFGKVFKAKHKNTDQFVAIKFLALEPHLEEQKKQRYIERFKRETQLSSQLQHPHIVRLLDKGQIDDHLLFGVFEYVDGISLRQHLTQEGALNAIDATDVMLQVLDALIHAHSRGIIHRDIKPANIMLTKSGAKTYAKILDFGIGTLVSEHRQPDFNTLTLTQETLGTPSYSAPEQLRGEPATTKTDLYVWGLVYLECLTGLPAITGSSIASIYHKQLSDVNVPLPAPLLGHPLASLLRRILKKNAIERVITSQESFNELNSINVANLVGILTKGEAQHGFDDETVVLRKDAQENSSANHTLLTERKQITVLALKISITEISTNTKDLDVIDALNKAQLNQCIDIATRFNAYHVGTLGDMLLFYFGFPVASDNDTRLSARTALEIMSEMSKRDALMQDVHGISFNIHIGLHTGVFVTYANTIPEGHITNTAMELARSAQAKQILCSGDSRAILEPYSEFEGTKLPNLQQPGSPATVYSLKGERQVEAFGFMRGTRNNHELIGREKELDKTLSVIKGENTHSHLIHIHGEAGIGKSRLLQEIRSHAGQYQHLVAQCLPEHQNNALYPVLTLIRYLFSTTKLDASSAVSLFSDIIAQQDNSIAIEQAQPILLIWLNIELPENIPASTLAPDQQKTLLFSSLTALLLSKHYSISENKLYIIEDIHWADTTTIEFIQHFAGQLNSGSVLISTSRQKVPTSLKDLTLMKVNLNKLTAQATEDFIIRLFDDQPVSRNVLDILTSRTDGIPLFIEELVGMLKQKALVSVIEGEINFVSPDKLDQVPSSLRESLQQKLDSLVHAKETAQLAATIGREFEYDLLVAASSLSENQIQNDLNELIANDLIIQQRRVSSDSYIFKHALVRDAAYDSSTSEHKKLQHKVIASTIEKHHSQYIVTAPASYILHLICSEQFANALENTNNFVNKSLIKNNYSIALELAAQSSFYFNKNLNHPNIDVDCVIDLLLQHNMLLMTTSGFASPKLLENIEILTKISALTLNVEKQNALYFSTMLVNIVVSNYNKALSIYKCSAIQDTETSNPFSAIYHFVNALMFMGLNKLNDAQVSLELSEKFYSSNFEDFYRSLMPYDLLEGIYNYQAQIATLTGNHLLYSHLEKKILKRIEQIDDIHTVVHGKAIIAQTLFLNQKYDDMIDFAHSSHELAIKHGVVNWLALSGFLIGWYDTVKKGHLSGIEMQQFSYQGWVGSGANSHRAWFKALMAEAYHSTGQHNLANDCLAEATTLLEQYDEKIFLSDINRIKGLLHA